MGLSPFDVFATIRLLGLFFACLSKIWLTIWEFILPNQRIVKVELFSPLTLFKEITVSSFLMLLTQP